MSNKDMDNNISPKKRNKKVKKKKQIQSDSEPDVDSDMEEVGKIGELEFNKLLASMFPSKHQNEKVKKMEVMKKLKNNSAGENESENTKKKKSNKNVKKKKSNKNVKKKKIKKEKHVKEYGDGVDMEYYSTEEEDYSEDPDYVPEEDSNFDEELDEELRYHDDEDYYEDEEEDMKEMLKGGGMKFNIIFTNPSGHGEYDEEYYDEEEYYEEESEEEEEEESEEEEEEECEKNIKMSRKEWELHKKEEKLSCKKCVEKVDFKKGDKVKVKLKDWDKYYKGEIIKVNKPGSRNLRKKKTMGKKSKTYNIKLNNKEYEDIHYVLPKYIKMVESVDHGEALKELEELMKLKKTKGSEAMMKKFNQLSKVYEKKVDREKKEKEAKEKSKNLKNFKKALRGKDTVNDFKYFKDMPIENQIKLIKDLKKMNEFSIVEKPYRIQLIESEIPVVYKVNAMKKINSLRWMDPGSGEYYKIKQWVDTFMTIPFNKYSSLPVSIDNTQAEYNNFMEEAKHILDEAVYGMNDAKMQILQLVGQWISNPKSIGTAIAIGGPPGTGKTTLVKEGISKILNRPFAFLALGGATDSSFLEGHSYTYEGSSWGKIVDILIQSKTMNPVIYFDELDKISNTPKGEEITGILTHLTDTTQNDKYHDKYFSSIDFNLSKALFIFSYNDVKKVNSILKDRLYRIHTDGYNNKDKCIIANKHLLPKIMKNVNFKEGEIIIPDETIEYISENLVEKEKGVRNLRRALEIVYTKLNLYRLMKKDSSLFKEEKSFEVKFPFTVTVDIVKKLVKKKDMNNIPFGMYL